MVKLYKQNRPHPFYGIFEPDGFSSSRDAIFTLTVGVFEALIDTNGKYVNVCLGRFATARRKFQLM